MKNTCCGTKNCISKTSGNIEEYRNFTVKDLCNGLSDQPFLKNNLRAAEIISNSYRKMKEAQKYIDPIYLPGGEWDKYIEIRKDSYDAILSSPEDASSVLSNFWRNSLGSIVKQYAAYDCLAEKEEERASFVEKMNIDLLVWRELAADKNVESLSVPNVGNHWGINYQGTLITPKALRYHLWAEQISNILGEQDRPVVAEVGAGYCGMAYYLTRLMPCVYLDFDLPETLILGAYYHLCTSPEKRIYVYCGEKELPSFSELIADYDLIFLPNWCLEKLPPSSISLFTNTFSFSEMPFSVLEKYFQVIGQACSGYLLHNNMDRAGVFQHGAQRIPASNYPLLHEYFRMIYKKFDSFQTKKTGRDGDYREYLYKKKG